MGKRLEMLVQLRNGEQCGSRRMFFQELGSWR